MTHLSLRLTTASLLTAAFVLPASAASVQVRVSESSHVTSRNGETVEQTERREEVRTDNNDARATLSTEQTNTRSSYRSTTCITQNGERRCTEQTDDKPSASLRTSSNHISRNTDSGNRRTWWVNWKNRLLTSWRHMGEVAADEDEDTAQPTARERAILRLVQRVCSRMEGDARDDCMGDAQRSDITSIRQSLLEWIREMRQQ